MFSFRLLLSALILQTITAVIRLETAEELFEGIQSGRWDVIIDTRNPTEWATGHIPNATFLDSLQRYNTSGEVTAPQDLFGCSYECSIVVYCASGNRAQGAAEVLEAAGFPTPIYNGLGVSQWTAAGYELVNTPSRDPPCNQAGTQTQPRSCETGELRPISELENNNYSSPDSGASSRKLMVTATLLSLFLFV